MNRINCGGSMPVASTPVCPACRRRAKELYKVMRDSVEVEYPGKGGKPGKAVKLGALPKGGQK